MRHVQLDGIVAGLSGTGSRIGEVVHDAPQLVFRQHIHRLAPAAAGDFQEVDDLQGDFGRPSRVDAPNQLAVAGDERVVA